MDIIYKFVSVIFRFHVGKNCATEMVHRVDRKSLTKLLTDAIPMLCKNSLPVSSAFRIEAMIGVTLINDSETSSDDSNVVLICIKQTVDGYGISVEQSYGETENDDIKPTIVVPGQVLEDRSCISNAVTAKTKRPSASAGTSSDLYSAVKQEYYPPHMYNSGPIDVDDEESCDPDEVTYNDEQDLYDPGDTCEAFNSGAVEDDEAYYDPSSAGDRCAKRMGTQYEGYENEFHQTPYDQSSDGFEPGRFQPRRPRKQGLLPQKRAKMRVGVSSAGAPRKSRMKSSLNPAASFNNTHQNKASQPTAISVSSHIFYCDYYVEC